MVKKEEFFCDEVDEGPLPDVTPLSPLELTKAFRNDIRLKGGMSRIERFNLETEKWEMLPESWGQFKRGSKNYQRRFVDFHQLLLLLNAEEKTKH